MTTNSKKVAVIGAGITGILSAYFLGKQGYMVTVYDQELNPAMRCSYANGGQVSVCNSETWTTWANVRNGLQWMFKKDAPLLIRPDLDFDKAIWLCKFLLTTANNDYARNTIETIKLGIESRKLYHQIIKEENLEFDQRYKGILHVYTDKSKFEQAHLVKEMFESNGCEWNIISDRAKLLEIEPNLKYMSSLIGGVYTSDDWTGDIHKFCTQLEKICTAKFQTIFLYDYCIDTIDDIKGYDYIVISGGVGSKKLAKSINDNLPVYPVKGYSITINLEDKAEFAPIVSLLDDKAKIVTSTLGNRFRVAGTAELAGENYDIRRDRIEPLLNWVHKNFPKINTHSYSPWACLRPLTPNMMPIIKKSKSRDNVFYHTGHGHLGWTLSPATAKQLVDLINI